MPPSQTIACPLMKPLCSDCAVRSKDESGVSAAGLPQARLVPRISIRETAREQFWPSAGTDEAHRGTVQGKHGRVQCALPPPHLHECSKRRSAKKPTTSAIMAGSAGGKAAESYLQCALRLNVHNRWSRPRRKEWIWQARSFLCMWCACGGGHNGRASVCVHACMRLCVLASVRAVCFTLLQKALACRGPSPRRPSCR